jgi:3-methylcrotonyl-CoA carboxylase alpha subunit
MFTKILIANRGEIACRVIRTARRLGIATVAVYSDADRRALHVDMADEAIAIGPAPARDSYLQGARIVDAALATGAQAIHPGYGFLSENADFAEACAAAGLVFIGPPAAAIRAMGSKAAAKALMERAGVPLVPGYHGDAQEFSIFEDAAAKIGYPVLVKASAGGGGKGMRVVTQPADLAAAIQGAQHESQASFGDDRLLIEKYLTRPRHIEIQVFADGHGNCVSLFERDCSIQRRHQKVLEESPAPFMSAERRHGMGEAAIAAARAVGYVGAGTVEFIAENDAFYFMEMNTRLQVEHPVTEMVTGLDLVEWQLRVASGEALPPAPAAPRGHAIEARLYAEDPSRDFLPSIGHLLHLRLPQEAAGVRVDSGVRQGDDITPYYDPMIAKLIVHADTRGQAVRRLAAALEACEVAGVHSNLALLRAIAAHPDYAGGQVDTGFIGRYPETLHEPDATAAQSRVVLAAVALDALAARRAPAQAADPWSPWDEADAWRLNGAPIQDLVLDYAGAMVPVRAAHGQTAVTLTVAGATHEAERLSETAIRLDGAVHRLRIVPQGDRRIVILQGRNFPVRLVDTLAPPRAEAAALGSLAAPIPARVTRLMAAAGDTVAKGAVLLTLEAMKMELTIAAPFDGVVQDIRHAVGDMVQEGTVLAVLAPVDAA